VKMCFPLRSLCFTCTWDLYYVWFAIN